MTIGIPFKKGNKINLGRKRSKEFKQSCRKRMLGTIVSEKRRKIASKTHKGKQWQLGRKQPPEEIKKRTEAVIKAWDLKGRKKYKRYIHVRDKKYLQWRSDVFTRDNWTCQTCGKRGVYLEAHHIKSWSHHLKYRYDVDNGITLCLECHELTDNYKNKKYDDVII